jgi:hypothetical protein
MMDTFNKALLLNQRMFEELRDTPDVVRRGLMIVLMVGLLVGGVQGIQYTLLFLNPTSNLAQAREQAEENIEQMLLNSTDPEQREAFAIIRENLDSGFAVAETVLNLPTTLPRPVVAIARGLGVMVSQPLNYLASLLLLVIFTHIAAYRFGGQGNIQQMLGLGALATAPLVLDALTIIPAVATMIWFTARVWSLVVLILATSVAHRIDTGRATLAVLLFPVLGTLLVVCGFCGLFALLVAQIASFIS